MLIEQVRLQYFRQHRDTTIDLPTGVVGIVGANGTGKSSVLEGVAWALYGTQATRGTKGSLRWNRDQAVAER